MKIELTIPGRPVPAQRMTRKSKWTDRAKRSLGYQKEIAWEWKAVGKRKLEGPLKLTCKFFFKDRRHGDLSNLRSEERRVGKECRKQWSPDLYMQNEEM